MTDTILSLTGLTEAAEKAGVTTDQARAILEAAGVKVEPEKPALPTASGSVIIATEVRGVKYDGPGNGWRMFCDPNGDWFSVEEIASREWHEPEHITAWAEARVVPVAATPVTLTEDQVGEEWDEHRVDGSSPWRSQRVIPRINVTRTVNAILAQHAEHDEGEPIDLADVLEGDRVRLELENGDEATITVKRVAPDFLTSELDVFYTHEIRSVHLLHREEA